MNCRQTKKMIKKECPNIQIKSKESVYNTKKMMSLIIMIRKTSRHSTYKLLGENNE